MVQQRMMVIKFRLIVIQRHNIHIYWGNLIYIFKWGVLINTPQFRNIMANHKHHILPKHMGSDNSPDNLTPPISVELQIMKAFWVKRPRELV